MRRSIPLVEAPSLRLDEARQQRVEISHLLELTDGSVYQAITYRPFKGMKQIAEQPSYLQPLQIAEAAVYPGFLNRRVRWEKGVDPYLAAPAAQLATSLILELTASLLESRRDFRGALEQLELACAIH